MTVAEADDKDAILVGDDEVGTHMRGSDLNAFGIGGDASWLRIEVLQYLLCVSHLAVGKLEASLDLVETSCREFGKRLINYPVGILYGIGRFLVEQLQEHTLAQVACANARRLHIDLNHLDQNALDLLLGGDEVLLELKVIDQFISRPAQIAIVLKAIDDVFGNEQLALVDFEHRELVFQCIAESKVRTIIGYWREGGSVGIAVRTRDGLFVVIIIEHVIVLDVVGSLLGSVGIVVGCFGFIILIIIAHRTSHLIYTARIIGLKRNVLLQLFVDEFLQLFARSLDHRCHHDLLWRQLGCLFYGRCCFLHLLF